MNLNDLLDVTISAPLNTGMTLVFNGTQWVNQVSGNPTLFLSNAAVSPAVAGAPTNAEILAAAGTNRDRVLYYTGSNLATDTPTRVYWIDNTGAVTLLDGPAGAANPTLHLTNTAVAPAAAGAPTIAEITAAAGTNRDRLLYYTGTDAAGDTPTRVYWIDVNGLVTLVETPGGGCAMTELGGVGGQLLVGDGAGIPNPVATGWTLQANGLHAVATTAPTGAPVVFEVRIEPAGTVLSTGTIAAGNNTATFTAFPDTAFADNTWVEVEVTASNGTAEELTVIGETCGPGGSSATPLVLTEVGEGSVLPANDVNGELFRLQGHATLPDGLYRWDFVSTSWVMV